MQQQTIKEARALLDRHAAQMISLNEDLRLCRGMEPRLCFPLHDKLDKIFEPWIQSYTAEGAGLSAEEAVGRLEQLAKDVHEVVSDHLAMLHLNLPYQRVYTPEAVEINKEAWRIFMNECWTNFIRQFKVDDVLVANQVLESRHFAEALSLAITAFPHLPEEARAELDGMIGSAIEEMNASWETKPILAFIELKRDYADRITAVVRANVTEEGRKTTETDVLSIENLTAVRDGFETGLEETLAERAEKKLAGEAPERYSLTFRVGQEVLQDEILYRMTVGPAESVTACEALLARIREAAAE